MSNQGNSELLSIAKNAVMKAGIFLSNRNQELLEIELETRRDTKIRADRESECIIIDYLEKETDFSLLSEEKGHVEKNKPLIWIIDPLDGSLNYFRNLRPNCVSIGLWEDNKAILGAVYDFNNDELFTGIVGKGAWLNGEKIFASSIERKENAVLCTGFPVNSDFGEDNLKLFIHKIQNYKKIRLFGSAALSLAYVAAGRADAYMENNIMIWDVAGGIPVALGAGCTCVTEKGTDINTFRVTVSNGRIDIN